jgi:serine/threonine protein phosphatase 1
MDILVIGDVHGCYYTLKKLISRRWDPESCILIQVGDLVNKGPHSVSCIAYWMKLEKKHPGRVVMLRGNHEQFLIQAIKRPFLMNPASRVLNQLKKSDLKTKKVRKWLESLPLKWENDHVLVTHAGISRFNKDPFHVSAPTGVLLNKGPLKDVGKVQVKGHSIVAGHKPVFNPKENTWYIDTGAWTNKYLTAIKLSWEGEKQGIFRLKTEDRDKSD